jgi:hypothetical protein
MRVHRPVRDRRQPIQVVDPGLPIGLSGVPRGCGDRPDATPPPGQHHARGDNGRRGRLAGNVPVPQLRSGRLIEGVLRSRRACGCVFISIAPRTAAQRPRCRGMTPLPLPPGNLEQRPEPQRRAIRPTNGGSNKPCRCSIRWARWGASSLAYPPDQRCPSACGRSRISRGPAFPRTIFRPEVSRAPLVIPAAGGERQGSDHRRARTNDPRSLVRPGRA